ncbi:MAG: hypothetical protein ACQKBU_06405 [Verrucomicrobiales bacterium]
MTTPVVESLLAKTSASGSPLQAAYDHETSLIDRIRDDLPFTEFLPPPNLLQISEEELARSTIG